MRRRQGQNINLKKRVFIVGEGITEQFYFHHLKRIKGYNCVVKPRFFEKTDISKIEKTVEKLLMGDVEVICVFDTDVSTRNKVENEKLIEFKRKYAKNECVIICDSLPSIEFWFLLHFVQTNKYFKDSKSVEKELDKYIKGYSKTKKYLENIDWVETLAGNQGVAMENVKLINVQEGGSYSYVCKAIDKLEL